MTDNPLRSGESGEAGITPGNLRVEASPRSALHELRAMALKILRREMKSYLGAILALILVCVALVVHEIFGEHGYLALRREKAQYQALQQQIQELQEKNQKLEKQIEGLKSDPRAIEKVAREQMRLARPGEIIYTLPDKDPKAEVPSSSAKETPPK